MYKKNNFYFQPSVRLHILNGRLHASVKMGKNGSNQLFGGTLEQSLWLASS